MILVIQFYCSIIYICFVSIYKLYYMLICYSVEPTNPKVTDRENKGEML
jgi:hypothetical protein